MKKISKILFISVILVFSVMQANAQLGIQAGYVYSASNGNLELGSAFREYNGTFRNNGFQGGLTYDFKIKGQLGMQTGLLYTIIGGTSTQNQKTINNITGKLRTASTYQFLDLPLRVSYSLPVTNDFKLFFFAGPNLTYALSGSSESTIIGDIYQIFPKIEDIYKRFENEISRFDLKAGFGGGVQYKKLQFKVGYDFGLLNSYKGEKTHNTDDKKYKLRRGQLNISLSFLLWR